jgi:hypothetical protein
MKVVGWAGGGAGHGGGSRGGLTAWAGIVWCRVVRLHRILLGDVLVAVPRMRLAQAGADLSAVPSTGGQVFRFPQGCV